MRKHVVGFVVMLLLGVGSAWAQGSVGAIKLGGAVSSLSGESNSEFEPRTGLAAGVAFGYDFGGGLAVIPELVYVVRGAYADGFQQVIIDGIEGRIPIRARFDLTYLEVPILVTYRFFRRSRIEPRLFAGPTLAYKLDARVRFRARESDGPWQTEVDDSVQTFDYGATVGAGAGFVFSGQQLLLDVRAQFGQSNVREAEPPLHNIGLAFFLGIQF